MAYFGLGVSLERTAICALGRTPDSYSEVLYYSSLRRSRVCQRRCCSFLICRVGMYLYRFGSAFMALISSGEYMLFSRFGRILSRGTFIASVTVRYGVRRWRYTALLTTMASVHLIDR